MKELDIAFRVVAVFLTAIFLAGLSVFIRRMTALEGILGLSNVILMMTFIMSRYGRSVPQLWVFGIVIVLVLIDGGTRVLPGMRNEGFPGDVVIIYVLEYLVIAWFGTRHFLLRKRKGNLGDHE